MGEHGQDTWRAGYSGERCQLTLESSIGLASGIPRLQNLESDDVSIFLNECISPPCPADLDVSGDVGFGDLLSMLSNWGPCPGWPQDLDGDDVVGFSDLLILLSAWGPCP